MSKGLRLSEKWFRRGLWLVAVVFAGFLVGLGGAVIGDLPKVEHPPALDDFLDRPMAERLRGEIKASEVRSRDVQAALEQAQLKAQVARSDSNSARDTFSNWLATRGASRSSPRSPSSSSSCRISPATAATCATRSASS